MSYKQGLTHNNERRLFFLGLLQCNAEYERQKHNTELMWKKLKTTHTFFHCQNVPEPVSVELIISTLPFLN